MTQPTCPLCSRASVERYKPFCSKRCADVDLSRWLRGGYAIPGAPAEDAPDSLSQSPENGRETND